MQQNNSITITSDRAWLAGLGVLGILVGLASLAMIWTARDVSQMQVAIAASQNERLRDMSDAQDREVQRLRDRLKTLEDEVSELRAYKSAGYEIRSEP